jgi:hypothetical protein
MGMASFTIPAGATVCFSSDDGQTWGTVINGTGLEVGDVIELRTGDEDSSRLERTLRRVEEMLKALDGSYFALSDAFDSLVHAISAAPPIDWRCFQRAARRPFVRMPMPAAQRIWRRMRGHDIGQVRRQKRRRFVQALASGTA